MNENDFSLEDLHALNNVLAYAMSVWASGPEGAERLRSLYERVHVALETEQEQLKPPIKVLSLTEMLELGPELDSREPWITSRGIPEDFMNRLEVSPILRWFGTWAVTEYGVESLNENYAFPWNRVDEDDWHRHMSEKCWVVMEDFVAALAYARTHKVKAQHERNSRE